MSVIPYLALISAVAALGLAARRGDRAPRVALRDWLAAQEQRRSAETALLDNRYSRLDNHIVLLQALGGTPSAGADEPPDEPTNGGTPAP